MVGLGIPAVIYPPKNKLYHRASSRMKLRFANKSVRVNKVLFIDIGFVSTACFFQCPRVNLLILFMTVGTFTSPTTYYMPSEKEPIHNNHFF